MSDTPAFVREHLREWRHELEIEAAQFRGETIGLRIGFVLGALLGILIGVGLR